MKIFILNAPPLSQPQKQAFPYPAHNRDYGVEQDFLVWLKKQKQLLTGNPSDADWHYLPFYWTRWHINHNFAADGDGLAQLQQMADKVIIDDAKTFTITQFDGGSLLNLGRTVEFTAGRTTNAGIDIPILCSPHKKPFVGLKKKYLAAFNGSFQTHPIRAELQQKYAGSTDVIVQGNLPTRFYKRWFWTKSFNENILRSYIALCPRGTNCTSFRFFEAMELGVAPCLIGDTDVRPFKKYIPWNEMSYYVSSINELDNLLSGLNKRDAIEKGKRAYKYWKNELYYQKWCKYVIKELEALNTKTIQLTV
ncbi:MAG: exostosin family protein [Bacteroidetes bacterium]|nr:exostosin family protein [Bacteroidota bacterium]